MVFSIQLLQKHNEKSLFLLGKSHLQEFLLICSISSLDLDVWINDPPSESEDESIPNNTPFQYNNNKSNDQGLFYGESYYHGSNLDSHGAGGSDNQQSRKYVEPTPEELERQRELRKQSAKMNPYYLDDTAKPRSTEKVRGKCLRSIEKIFWNNLDGNNINDFLTSRSIFHDDNKGNYSFEFTIIIIRSIVSSIEDR